MDEGLVYEILSVVAEIPLGRVCSYGEIARLVGKILSSAELYGDYPCHRVVNHAGRIAPHWPRQRQLLEDEGVTFRPNGTVNMSRHLWWGE